MLHVVDGINRKLERCPRCGQLLVDEGYAYYCKYGCTRMFPKLGALISDRFEFERKGGLVTAQHELNGRLSLTPSKQTRRVERDRQRYAETFGEDPV